MPPSDSAAHANLGSILMTMLFSGVIFSRHTPQHESAPLRRYCLLHFSIGLPIREEERFAEWGHAAKLKSLGKSGNGSCRTQISSRCIRHVTRSLNGAITVGVRRALGRTRNGERKCSSRTIIQRCPQSTMMAFDNRAADG